MTHLLNRPLLSRHALWLGGMLLAAQALIGVQAASADLHFGPEQPFSFDALIERASRLAKAAYAPPPRPMPSGLPWPVASC